MDWWGIALIALIVLFMLNRMMPTKGVTQMTTAQLKGMLQQKDMQFVDVRTPGEYKSRHIPGFKNIPLNEISAKASQLSKEKEVIVMCQSGMRSNQASKQLKKLGFQKVTNVKGGMSAWEG